jgi:hypothetical protein
VRSIRRARQRLVQGTLLFAPLACGDAPRLPVESPIERAPPSALVAPVASARWSEAPPECDGVFIAARRHCHRADAEAPAVNPPRTLVWPHVLVVGGETHRLVQTLTERCIGSEEQTVLPVEGLELEVRLAPKVAPVVVRGDDRLGVALMACVARVVSERNPTIEAPVDVTVTFFPGDLHAPGWLRTDDQRTPIYFQIDDVDWPLTRAVAVRLLRHRAPAVRACFEKNYDGAEKATFVAELELPNYDGSPVRVTVSEASSVKGALADCLTEAHYGVESTVHSTERSTKFAFRYLVLGWERGP